VPEYGSGEAWSGPPPSPRESLGILGNVGNTGIGVGDIFPPTAVPLALSDVRDMQEREKVGLDVSGVEKALTYSAVPLSAVGVGSLASKAGKIGSRYTTKTLERLFGRDTVKKKFITDLLNRADVTQAEKNLVRQSLDEYEMTRLRETPEGGLVPPNKINVKDFTELVQDNALPLQVNDVQRYATQGLSRIGVSSGEVLPGTRVYTSPVNTMSSHHFKTADEPGPRGYFAHSRYFDTTNTDISGKLLDPNSRDTAKSILSRLFTAPDDMSLMAYETKYGHGYSMGLGPYDWDVIYAVTPGNIHSTIWNMVDSESSSMKNVKDLLLPYIRRAADTRYVRNVVEVQSDFFQKPEKVLKAASPEHSLANQSDVADMISRNDPVVMNLLEKTGYDVTLMRETADLPDSHMNMAFELMQDPRFVNKFKELQSQTVGYQKNWWRRVVREEINRAAIDGVDTVRFPTGSTASIVARWSNALQSPEDFMNGMKYYFKLHPSAATVGDVKADLLAGSMELKYSKMVWNEASKLKDSDPVDKLMSTALDQIDKNNAELVRGPMRGSADFSGLFDRYDKNIAGLLKKEYGAKSVRDDKGYSWIELNIAPEHEKDLSLFNVAPPIVGAGIVAEGVEGDSETGLPNR
jgi:hypothetical protein